MSEIEVYQRALSREKKSKQVAEQLLDDKTRELYDSVLTLQNTVDELEETQNRLIHSEKMASIGQLAAGVAHEINNPIGFITSNINTLKDYLADFNQLDQWFQAQQDLPAELAAKFQETRKHLDIDYISEDSGQLIQESINGLERVKSIVANLSRVSRTSDGEFLPTDINHCINESIKTVWNELKYKIELELQLTPDIEIHANEGELQQVLINMLVNASHACPEQGEICVTSKMANKKGQDYVLITIKDNGNGIEKEHIKKLFDPFFTTKPVGEGTGLGLSVSYGIIEKHQGWIDVESEVGKGTEFFIYLSTDPRET